MTNFFIANLALADVIIGLFAIPFQVCRDTITDSVVMMITVLIMVMMILTLRCTCLGYHCVPVPSRSASEMEPSLLPLPILPFLSGLYKTLMFRQVFVKNYILSGDYVIKDFFFLLLTNSALKEHSFTLFEQNIYRTHGKGETFKHKPLFASEKSTQRNV